MYLSNFCNGQIDYRVRGVHVRLEVPWDWQAERGDNTHQVLYRRTRCRHAVRQGPAERFRPELYVLAENDIRTALQRRIAAVASEFPCLYDALLRQLSRTALHPRLQAHAPHHLPAHHLAPSLDGNSGVVGLQCVRNLPEK